VILDYTGRELVIRPAQGPERRFAADRIVEIQTSWPAGYDRGREHLRRRDYAVAERELAAANIEETRPWARRAILGELARALLGQDRVEHAGEVVLAVLASDSSSRHLDLLPLAWASDADLPQPKAEGWLARPNDAAANLLGASHLLATSRSPDAVAVLRHLTAAPDPRIAALAEAQLWRRSVATADLAEVQRWQAAIERMPRELRAGPSFVAGQVLRRLGRPDDATLALLRVPIHAPEQSHLAARALVEAAQELAAAGHTEEAVRLAQEVAREYATAPSAQAAEELIRRLEASAGSPSRP
jgi:hypothetical protein